MGTISRDAPIIPQNLPIILLGISPEPSQLFLTTKPIILDNNFYIKYNAEMKSGNNYRRPVEVLSSGWGCVVS